MNYYEEETPELIQKKQKEQQIKIIVLLLGVGVFYYLLVYLPNKRNRAIQEIKTMLKNNPVVNLSDLDANLWANKENYEEHLDNLYFSSQINLFTKEMKKAIGDQADKTKGKSIEELRQEAIDSIREFAGTEIKFKPSLEKEIKKFYKRIKQVSSDDISIIADEANIFITEQTNKRIGFHWLREPKNWADKKLELAQQTFVSAWTKFCETVNKSRDPNKEPQKCIFGADYIIKFPPSLWNSLTDEQKAYKRAEELKLKDNVESYTFNPKIDNWYEKTLSDPVRGEREENGIDNNATLYGAPRTGKSIVVEKLAYHADRYPLVVIQGSKLTPNLNDQVCSIENFNKFIYTICDINNTLVDDFGLERNSESGEPQYIFFIDEANQVSENTFSRKSSGLTFLKECMGSDDYKSNESHNLWIIATNHLSEIDEAVYQPGRLGNQLNFSWTLGKFKEYATDAGIYHDFPEHWKVNNSLSKEDGKWVTRFNIIIFQKEFLGREINGGEIENGIAFWDRFINNPDNKEILEEIKEEETDEQTGEVIIDPQTNKPKEIIRQKGIPFGEFLEFFWQKYDSGELWDKDFDAKFTSPREPKIAEVIVQASNHISKSLDVRLKELGKIVDEVKNEMQSSNDVFHNNFTKAVEDMVSKLVIIGEKMK